MISVHEMFISLVTSLMSFTCSWTHVDSLDDVCNSFHSCHGFAVHLVDSFSLFCFWDVLECFWDVLERHAFDLN